MVINEPYGMTDPKDPGNDPKFHADAKDDEYAYSDRDSREALLYKPCRNS